MKAIVDLTQPEATVLLRLPDTLITNFIVDRMEEVLRLHGERKLLDILENCLANVQQ